MSYRWSARTAATAVNACKSTVVQSHPLLYNRMTVTTALRTSTPQDVVQGERHNLHSVGTSWLCFCLVRDRDWTGMDAATQLEFL